MKEAASKRAVQAGWQAMMKDLYRSSSLEIPERNTRILREASSSTACIERNRRSRRTAGAALGKAHRGSADLGGFSSSSA